MTDTPDIKALRPSERTKLGFVTDDNTGGHYVAECEECGQIFPSQTCDGGEQIADSGDYGDCYCPHCGFIDPLECDNANLVWNVQQLKIINLTKQLEAERQRADNASFRENHLNDMLNEKIQQNVDLRAELAALKGDQVPVYGPYSVAFIGPGVWATIVDELPAELDGEKVWISCDPIFTAPQKPVVLPGIGGMEPTSEPEFINYADGWRDGINECRKAIKAADGIVKDGD